MDALYKHWSQRIKTISPEISTSSGVDETQQFMLWALSALCLKVESHEAGLFSAEIPEKLRPAFAGAEKIQFTFDADIFQGLSESEADSYELVTLGTPLFLATAELLEKQGPAIHQVPAQQPESINELTPQLFQHYTFDDGNIHLAGCLLEDRPFLRLTFLDEQAGTLSHWFATAEGTLVEPELREQLNLGEIVPLSGRPPRLLDTEINQWVSTVMKLSQEHLHPSAVRHIATTVIWCKYVTGKLSFRKEEQSAELPFAGWAQQFKDEQIQPPPYDCPLTGSQSYHLTTTDEGVITNESAVGICSQSEKRVLKKDLETCRHTGQQALSQYLETCPVSGRRILRSALEPCVMCRQSVDPESLHAKKCQACRSLQGVSKHDPRMARLLTQFPNLDRWRYWKISETTSVDILTAGGLLQKLLLVVDKDSLEVLFLASGHRFSSGWSEVSASQAEEYLR